VTDAEAITALESLIAKAPPLKIQRAIIHVRERLRHPCACAPTLVDSAAYAETKAPEAFWNDEQWW
jgi:hypothetical protein